MKTATPWIVTGSLATLALAGGIGAALAGPAEDRELTGVTTGVVSQRPASPAPPPTPTPGAGSVGAPALPPGGPAPGDAAPVPESAPSPVVVSAASPVVVSAASPLDSPESADSGWSAPSGDSGD